MSFNYGGGTHPLVFLLVAIFIIALAYIIIMRNPNFLKLGFKEPEDANEAGGDLKMDITNSVLNLETIVVEWRG